MMRLVIAIAALAALAGVARADIPPQTSDPCLGQQAGDRCNAYFVKDGVCTRDRDGSFRNGILVDVGALRCRPDNKGVAEFALAFGLVAVGTGVLVVRWRRRRA
jgi:hypothetical protein